MSNAIAGPGFILSVAGTPLAEVKDITGPEQSADVIDVTNQDSPNHFEEIIPSLLHGGAVTFDVNFIPGDASQTALLGFLLARTVQACTIVVGTVTISFSAYCVKYAFKLPVANVAAATIDLRVTGPVTVA